MPELTDFFEFLKFTQYKVEERKETNVFKTAFKVFLIICIVVTLINWLIYLIRNRFNFSTNKLQSFWKSNVKYVFHFSAISFGMIHLFNFDSINWWMILIAPLLVAPFATLGYVIGYIRLKYGFVFGWLIHATLNLGSTLFSLHLLYVVVLFYAFALFLNYLLKRYTNPVPD